MLHEQLVVRRLAALLPAFFVGLSEIETVRFCRVVASDGVSLACVGSGFKRSALGDASEF